MAEHENGVVEATATEIGTDVERHEAFAMAERTAYDRMDQRRLALIKSTVASKATDAEVGMFLELAWRYDLDPFAKEVWCAVSEGQTRRLLVMVGRDGLRKIALRRGLRIDGDVVRAKDEFAIQRAGDRSRKVSHAYAGSAEQRGPVVGAWAEVWEPRSSEQRGFFFAPLSEYKPRNEKKLQYSPWGSQESVMILAAAERQALRQATPLSGLMAEGEMDLAAEREAPATPEPEPVAEPIDEAQARELYDTAMAAGVPAARFQTAVAAMAGRDPGDLGARSEAVARMAAVLQAPAADRLAKWIGDKAAEVGEAADAA
jgi:hypothetical protein